MRRAYLILCIVLPTCVMAQRTAAPQHVAYKDSTLAIDARVRDLLGRMTLEEKFWQLWMVPGDLDSGTTCTSTASSGCRCASGATRPAATTRRAAARRMAGKLNAIQRFFVERTRLGIPIIPFEEAVHGLYGTGATMFPPAIALAATWDTSLMGACRDGDRDGSAHARHPAGALAGDQHRERRALGASGGDVRRRSVAHVGDGAGVRPAVREDGRGDDAEALRRERRRGRTRQLSDRLRRAPAR